MVRRVPGLGLLVPLVHGEVGDPAEFEVGFRACLFEAPMLVGKLRAELQPQLAHALPDPLRIVVPHRRRPQLRRDNHQKPGCPILSGFVGKGGITDLRFNRLRQRRELRTRLQPRDVQQIEPAVAEASAHLAQQRLARRAAQFKSG